MQYQVKPKVSVGGFCEDFSAMRIPKTRTLLSLPITLTICLSDIWFMVGRWERGVAAFYGLILLCLTAFSV